MRKLTNQLAGLAWAACLLTVTMGCSPLLALDPNQPLGQLYHTSWNAKDGLNGSVTALAQTQDGFLWIGTSDGLFRFDGLSFEPCKPEVGSLISTAVSSLMAVPDGGLWIGYLKGGVSFLKDGTVTNYSEHDGLPFGRVKQFARDRDGTVWAAVVGGFSRFEGQRWRRVGMDWDYPGKSAWTVFVDQQGTLWVTADNRVRFLLRGEKKFRDSGIHTGGVFTFGQAPDGTLFFNDNDLDSLRAFRWPLDVKEGGLPNIKIPARAILFDRDGALWIAGVGVTRVSFPKRLREREGTESSPEVQRFTERDGLTDNFAPTVLEDREGNIWIGTAGGLDRFRRRNLAWFPLPEGTAHISLVPGDNGDVWAGSNADTPQPIVRVQGGKPVRGGPNVVWTTYRSSNGTIWFSGLNSFWRWMGGKFTKITLPDQLRRMLGKDPMTISSITSDQSGTLWVSIGGGGEFQWKDGSWKSTEILKNHPDWAANAAFTDSAGRVWLALGDLIAVSDHGKVQAFSKANGLSVAPVNVIAGGENRVWVGGESGVAFLAEERFHSLLGIDGSGFGSITGIIAPPGDGLWLSGGAGIIHVTEQELQRALHNFGYKVNYELFDLVSDLPEQLQRASSLSYSSGAVQASDGMIWFATRRGAARVDPAHILRNSIPPPVAIRSVIADGRHYSALGRVATLPALIKNLRIDYTALSLAIPERVRFRYALTGVDRDWQDAGPRRQAFYTNLPPGRYAFRVIACNNDGIWNEQGATLAFSVAAAWYQTNWFRALCAAVLVFLVWAAFQWRVRQVQALAHIQMEERSLERARIARELHDTLLQSFQGLVLNFQRARNLLPRRPTEAVEALDNALDRAERALVEGRDAIHDIRSSAHAANDLVKELTVLGEELASDSRYSEPPTFHVVVEGTPQALNPIVRDEIYRIAREAIRNAYAHSGARRIEAEISYDESLFRLRVRDNGVGMDGKLLGQAGRVGHWGLPGMRERATRLGGQLEVWSECGAGTEIELRLPNTIAYGPASRDRQNTAMRDEQRS